MRTKPLEKESNLGFSTVVRWYKALKKKTHTTTAFLAAGARAKHYRLSADDGRAQELVA